MWLQRVQFYMLPSLTNVTCCGYSFITIHLCYILNYTIHDMNRYIKWVTLFLYPEPNKEDHQRPKALTKIQCPNTFAIQNMNNNKRENKTLYKHKLLIFHSIFKMAIKEINLIIKMAKTATFPCCAKNVLILLILLIHHCLRHILRSE